MSGHSKWANIKRKKELRDGQKGKVFTKLGREIVVAIKQGGPDPITNNMLRLAIERAKSANMPNENIQRQINKANSTEAEQLSVTIYEVYGPGGSLLLVECLTDNVNRTVTNVKQIVQKAGFKLANPGSISWQFSEVGRIMVSKADEETILQVIDLPGVLDVEAIDDQLAAYTNRTDLYTATQTASSNGLRVDSAEIIRKPATLVSMSEAELDEYLELYDKLSEIDEVNNIWSNISL